MLWKNRICVRLGENPNQLVTKMRTINRPEVRMRTCTQRGIPQRVGAQRIAAQAAA